MAARRRTKEEADLRVKEEARLRQEQQRLALEEVCATAHRSPPTLGLLHVDRHKQVVTAGRTPKEGQGH